MTETAKMLFVSGGSSQLVYPDGQDLSLESLVHASVERVLAARAEAMSSASAEFREDANAVEGTESASTHAA